MILYIESLGHSPPFILGCIALGLIFVAVVIHNWRVDLKSGKIIRKQVDPATDWDEEFLRAEAAKHVTEKIEAAKLVFTFDKNPKDTRHQMDGFTWYCTCGVKGNGIDLAMCDRTFQKHQKDMREAALAQLGRFK